jgi:hypothetical protein
MKEKVILLVLGFILTTGIGSGITYWIQYDQSVREQEERERVRAEAIFSEIGGLLDERIWVTGRILWAKCQNSSVSLRC